MDVSIVIVNWNSGAQLRECLASIASSAHQLPSGHHLARVVVVDNASSDGSADDLALTGVDLRVLHNCVNRGFGAACNAGAADIDSELILFLNPDTRLFDDSLSTPTAFMARPGNADIGIVGIQLIDDSGKVARSCTRFPGPFAFLAQAVGLDRLLPNTAHFMREWDHAQTREVDHVIGAFYLVRRSLFAALGGFDESFFVYLEDLDLSLRAHRAGSRIVFLAAARAYHKGGGTSAQVLGRRLFYSLRSRQQYGRKHFSDMQRLLLGTTTWLVEPLTRILHLTLTARIGAIGNVLEAYWLLATEKSTTPRR